MTMLGVLQERSPLRTPLQRLRLERQLVEAREQLADCQAPVRVQVIHHPVVLRQARVMPLHPVQRMPDVAAVILVGPPRRHVPVDQPRRHHEGRQKATRAVPDVLRLTSVRAAEGGRLVRVDALQRLDAGLLVGREDYLPLPEKRRRLQVQPTDVQRLLLELGVVAVHPRPDLVRLQLGLRQDALDGAAVHVPEVGVVEDVRGQVVQRPVRHGRAFLGGLGGRQHQDLVPVFRGKKRPGGRCGEGR